MQVLVPESILARGRAAVAAHIYRATAVGSFLRQDWVRTMLAEDQALLEIEPLVHCFMPMEHEKEPQNDWKASRPVIHEKALVLAKESLSHFAPFDRSIGACRLALRMAAFRKIDCKMNAEENFHSSEELTHNPYLQVEVPGFPRPMRIGKGTTSIFKSDQQRDALTFEMMGSPDLIYATERLMAAFWPETDSKEEWSRLLDTIDTIRPLREWEKTRKVPYLGGTWWFDLKNMPEEISVRPSAKAHMESVSHEGGLVILHNLGITPFLPNVSLQYLSLPRQVKMVEERAGDFSLGLDAIMGSEFLHDAMKRARSRAA